MIDIYLEDLLGALFLHGYDRVDGILYSKVIDDVTSKGTKFRFLGRGCSEEFSKIFHYDGFAYFVDGDLDFTPNEELQDFIIKMDKVDLLKRKLEYYNKIKSTKYDLMFSSLELKLIKTYFPEENIVYCNEEKTMESFNRVLEIN